MRFDNFLLWKPALQDQPIGVMLEHWAAEKATRNHAVECENLRRVFAKILRHRDPSMPVRLPDPRPKKEAAKQWRKPHIYSPADVRRMLDVARAYPSPRVPLRPLSMCTRVIDDCQRSLDGQSHYVREHGEDQELELSVRDRRRCKRLIALSPDGISIASHLHEFTRRSDFNPSCVGLVGIDVHLGERGIAHPYQGTAKDEGAILVGDTDIDIFAVLDVKASSIGGIRMDVPGCNDKPIRDDTSGRPCDGDLRRRL